MKNIICKLLLVLSLVLFFPKPEVISAKAKDETKKITINSYSATISWVTDKPSTSLVEYGTDATCGNNTTEDINLTIYHKVTLYNLTPSTQYYYRVKSKDSLANEAVSGDFTFVTLKEPPRDQPPQISDVEADSIVAAGPQSPDEPKPQTRKKQTSVSGQAGQASGNTLIKQEEPIKRALIEKGGILLGKGKLQVEPSITYVHTSANRISIEGYTILPVLVVGEISTANVQRDILIETLSARYGLRRDLQIDVSVPYRMQHDRVSIQSPASETNRQLSGLGDISSGIFYQCAYESGLIPDMIAGISVKSRTGLDPYGRDIGIGTGHWGIKGNLVAVKSSDPAILFASLGYTYSLQRNNIPDYGSIKPGDCFDYSLGASFGLNYQLAVSFQLQQSVTQRMRMNGNSIPGSFTNLVSFKYGVNWSISKNLSCGVSATHGLTTDAPDFVLEVRLPYTF